MIYAFLLTFLAASTTIFGGIISTFLKKENSKLLSIALSFSGGVMIYLSFIEILPKGINYFKESGSSPFFAIVSFFVGILTLIIVDKSTPEISHPNKSSIQKIGLMSFFLITLHNFPEGMATFSIIIENDQVSFPLILAIAIHNIPEGIVVAIPIYFSSGNKLKAILFSSISALAEPIGGLFGYILFKNLFNDLAFGVIFSFVAGIMIFLSIDQILPEARKNGNHHVSGYGVIFGMLFMSVSLFLLTNSGV